MFTLLNLSYTILKELKDNLSDKCCKVFSKDNCELMQEVCNKSFVSPLFEKESCQIEKIIDKIPQSVAKCSEKAEKTPTSTKPFSLKSSTSKGSINDDTSNSQVSIIVH